MAFFLSLLLVCVGNGCKTLEKTEDRRQKTEVQVDTLWLEPIAEGSDLPANTTEATGDGPDHANETLNRSEERLPSASDSLGKSGETTEELGETMTDNSDSIAKTDPPLRVVGDTLMDPGSGLVISGDTVVEAHRTIRPPKKASAFEVKVERTAVDSVVQDVQEKLIHYYGNAVVKYNDIVLEANYLQFDLNTNVVTAKGLADSTGRLLGTPKFTQGETKFEAEEMSYNFQTQKGIIRKVWTEESGGYIHGEKIKRMDDNSINIRSGGFTTCSLKDHPHYQFRFTKAKIIPDDMIVTGPVYVTIQDVPLPIVLPFAMFPNTKGQKSGLIIPTYGESANRGFYLENGGYYWALNEHYDLQLLGDIYTRGSWAVKPTFRYAQRYKHNGSLALGFAVNKIGDEGAADYNKSTDFKVKWTHQQDRKAHPRHSFSADVNIISSNFNKYNATTSNEYLSNTFKSSVAYQTNFGGKVYLTLNASHSQNTLTKQVTASLPEVTLTANRIYPFQKLKTRPSKWKTLNTQLSNLNVSYTMNAKNYLSGIDTLLFPHAWYEDMGAWFGNLQKYTQSGIKHTIPVNLPVKLFKHFTWTTSANFNDYMYFNRIERQWMESDSSLHTDTIRGFRNLVDFNLSSNLTTKLYGMVNFRRGPVRAIRHVLTPTVGITYRPDFSDPKWNVYDQYVDANGNIQTYNMFMNALYGTPSQNRSGLITYSFNNTLDLKVPSKSDTITGVKKVVLLESLGFSGNYDLTKDSLNFSYMSVSGRTTLFKKLKVSYSSVWDPYALDSLGHRTNQLEILENRKLFHKNNSAWNFSLGWSFNQNDLKNGKRRTENGKPSDFNDRIASEAAGSEFVTPGELDDILGNPNAYVDWTSPWSLSLNYNLRYSTNMTYAAFMGIANNQIVQTLSVNGDISLTPKWKVTFSTGWDFTNHGLSYTSLNIYRDLHCWEMRFNWIPIGNYKSWNFTINVKAQALQELKLTKKKDYRDN